MSWLSRIFSPNRKKLISDKFALAHTYKGKSFYRYKNILEMPYQRHEALSNAQRFASMGVNKEILEQRLDVIIEAFNQNKMADAIVMISDLRARTQMPVERLTLRECCAIYFIHQDEPIGFDDEKHIYSQEWTNKKIKMLEQDQHLEGFFFHLYLKSLSNLDEESLMLLRQYLTMVDHNLRYQNQSIENIVAKYGMTGDNLEN